MITNLNSENFDKEIKNGLKLIEFYTTWCGYCKKQKPELEQMDKVWIGLADAEDLPNIAKKYQVSAFPTFIIFRDGEPVERFSGLKNKEEIMDKLMKYLK